MKRECLPFTFCLCFYVTTFSQAPLVKQWDKRFGCTWTDGFRSFQQTTDGGFILGGYSISDSTGDKTQNNWSTYSDFWIVKTNASGDKQWDKRFGGTDRDDLWDIKQTSDAGYILGGNSSSPISGDKSENSWNPVMNKDDYWVIKIDSAGAKQWDRRYGGTKDEFLYRLQQTFDGGYILGGFSISDSSGDKTQNVVDTPASSPPRDFWVVKIDSVGNKEWDKNFGGYGSEYLNALIQTRDGGYLLGGQSNSPVSGDKTQPTHSNIYFADTDYWIVKLDASGNKQWDKDFGGNKSDGLASLAQTTDGGYILGGGSGSGVSGDKTTPLKGANGDYDYWIIKIDSLGNKEWDKDYGGTGSDGIREIVQTLDKGFLLSGTSQSNIGGDKTENNLGVDQTWLIKTDSLGNKQWDKTIFASGYAMYGYAIPIYSGCYAIASNVNAGIGGDKTEDSRGGIDYWLVKSCDTSVHCNTSVSVSVDENTLTAYNGVYYQWYLNGIPLSNGTSYIYTATQVGSYTVVVTYANGCAVASNPIIVSGLESVTYNERVALFPNPATSQLNISIDETLLGAQLNIYNTAGVLVRSTQLETVNSKLETSQLANGIYIAEIKLKDTVQRVKWVKM